MRRINPLPVAVQKPLLQPDFPVRLADLLAYAGAGVGHRGAGVLQVAFVFVGLAVDAAYRLVYLGTVTTLCFTQARVGNSYA